MFFMKLARFNCCKLQNTNLMVSQGGLDLLIVSFNLTVREKHHNLRVSGLAARRFLTNKRLTHCGLNKMPTNLQQWVSFRKLTP